MSNIFNEIYLVSYILLIPAAIRLFRHYQRQNWVWLAAMVVGGFIGIAPFIAIVYLIFSSKRTFTIGHSTKTSSAVVYSPDGSYTVYKTEQTTKAPTLEKVSFRVAMGVLAAVFIVGGLLTIGMILLIATIPASSNAKSM